MAGSKTKELPEKDFKAVVENDRIQKVGISYFEQAFAAQPLYKFEKEDFEKWLSAIVEFCESQDEEKRKLYAEEALNTVLENIPLNFYDVGNKLCQEVDNPDDLAVVSNILSEIKKRTVYICFSTDILHNGHLSLIKKAKRLGRVIVGVLKDEVIASYKRYPLVPFSERKAMFENIAGVYQVVEQSRFSL